MCILLVYSRNDYYSEYSFIKWNETKLLKILNPT